MVNLPQFLPHFIRPLYEHSPRDCAAPKSFGVFNQLVQPHAQTRSRFDFTVAPIRHHAAITGRM